MDLGFKFQIGDIVTTVQALAECELSPNRIPLMYVVVIRCHNEYEYGASRSYFVQNVHGTFELHEGSLVAQTDPRIVAFANRDREWGRAIQAIKEVVKPD